MEGGLAPTVLNAANEVAVDAFLHDKIGFLDIADFAENALARFGNKSNPTIEDIIETDKNVRRELSERS